MTRLTICLGICGTLWIHAAAAQTTLPSSPPLPPIQGAPQQAQPQRGDELPPYQPQLERLSELMGTLAFMSPLCGRKDGDEWRKRMTALLDTEARTPLRKERLAGAYNRGFKGYEATYRACTASGQLVITRSLAEGDRIARDLSTRFGGG